MSKTIVNFKMAKQKHDEVKIADTANLLDEITKKKDSIENLMANNSLITNNKEN